jgi:CRP-like cAMP-binding protein
MENNNTMQSFCDLVKAAEINRDIKYVKNDFLFKENELADGIFYISQGKVKIQKNNNLDTPVILHIAKEGELLGVHAVINNTKHANSAIALDDVETCYVPAKEFTDAINKDNSIKLMIMQSLCSRINRIENQISSRSEKSANQRFAEVLTFLAKDYGLSNDNRLNIDLSLEELASLAGTSKNYLTKIIYEFSHNGWIQSEQGHFKILQMPQLEEMART